jgi:hypothetical protein
VRTNRAWIRSGWVWVAAGVLGAVLMLSWAAGEGNPPRASPVDSGRAAAAGEDPAKTIERLKADGLEKAAMAGVHGAPMAYVVANTSVSTPGHDARPDPRADNLKAVLAGAATGDLWSLLTLSGMHENGDAGDRTPNIGKSLLYGLLANRQHLAAHGREIPGHAQAVARLSRQLPDEEVRRVFEEAQRFEFKAPR